MNERRFGVFVRFFLFSLFAIHLEEDLGYCDKVELKGSFTEIVAEPVEWKKDSSDQQVQYNNPNIDHNLVLNHRNQLVQCGGTDEQEGAKGPEDVAV